MKIGIMGGTFDPIHNGHLMLGEAAYQLFHLDEVWFMPNGNPPHKHHTSIKSDVEDRVEMVRLAIEGYESFHLQQYEAQKKEISYSFETLEHFNKIYEDYEFYFIIGADSLFAIEGWIHPERIFPTCTILAAYRDDIDTKEEMCRQINYLRGKFHAKIELLATPLMHISSSELRTRLKQGGDISRMVPEKVREYIKNHHLYKEV
ncbi:nicotinate-nucleotide adenylyltransferase [Dorea sp. D27]|uniref:nicotinate-nucleotide adenylyltransferase n=1 Tax=Dorea sp. D27 TaxID=658665 RepID=UPI0006737818|nr:nicotinate-nucleotide adenylyltransferase [Dorea sp. D27]KMZ54963.1 nicotinate-nucleotide adenylyltransferase [Dorea sp. D27]